MPVWLPNFVGHAILIGIGGVLVYLAIKKRYEPWLLLPIGFGIMLTNIPGAGMMDPGGLFYYFKKYLIDTRILPLLIFMGIGAMTDFGPLLAHPRSFLLGAAAQFGIFATLLGAIVLGFNIPEAASIGIIGGADGPTAIYTAAKLAPHILPIVAIAAYSYMALVPIIQPPIMRALTTSKERGIVMRQLRQVSQSERILFPISVTVACALLLPVVTPLIGMLMMGNLMRESGVVERLAKTTANEMINGLTILLGLTVGGMLTAEIFMRVETIGILLLGVAAFGVATASGVLIGKLMCKLSGGQVNPLIGAAGVSAVPMAARVAHVMGQKENPRNFLLMHAMGPNVAGVIGSAMAAGVFLTMVTP